MFTLSHIKVFADHLILSHQSFTSASERKRILLAGYLILISFFTGTFYLFIALFFYGRPEEAIFHAINLLISFACFWLIRNGKHTYSIFIQLIMANGVVSYFVSIDSPTMGSYMFFLTNGLGAFVLFGFDNRVKAIALIVLSYVLFLITILDVEHFKPGEDNFYLVINFTVVLIISVLILYFLMLINHDSERQITEKNNSLTKTNAELDRFVYSTSHDLRAPLTSILGLIGLSKSSTDLAEVQNYIGLMANRVHKLNDFINEITDYSRNARLEVNREEINLNLLIKEAIDDLKHMPEANKITVELNIDTHFTLHTDKKRLKTIVGNLLSNALKYSDSSKTQPYLKISAHKEKKDFRLLLEDNGIGIDSAHKDRIFDMFYRASEKSTGSGLGLYIVKETLTKLNGTIDVESTAGKGATFKILLPIIQ